MNLQIKVQTESNETNKRGVGSISQEMDGESETPFNMGVKGKTALRVDRRKLQIKDIDK